MQIIMPKLGLTMTEGTITEWVRAPGDAVKAEEALCSYETEKVTLELVAPADGVLGEILAPAGTTVPSGAPVCEFRTAAEARRQPAKASQATSNSITSQTLPVAPLPNVPAARSGRVEITPKARRLAAQWDVSLDQVTGRGPNGRVQAIDVALAHAAGQPATATPPAAEIDATPLARRIASADGIDISEVQGSGPDGRVTRVDVEDARRKARPARDHEVASPLAHPTTQAPQHAVRSTPHEPPLGRAEEVIPMTGIRRVIAQRMSESAFTAPHVTLFTEAEATNLVSAHAQLNLELSPENKLSYNALLAALTARALREHPRLNARLAPDGIHLLPEINLALAVDTERGLMTPVLRGVDRLTLPAIQAGYAALIDRALVSASLPEDFADGTFTITNLGAWDVDGFTPIINPPQAAILGVGRIAEKAVARDGGVVARPMVTLSLSFDHRIVDGAAAARFLQRVKQLVERPLALLLT
ncbi:MAG: hypothetical protein AUK03_10120 [Anaerolineae bacterium CG2_30_64_16]|nr:MAG: hypothetical protein AUK03_10120 [Anaerolineae bacterium CG2_30_64_16]